MPAYNTSGGKTLTRNPIPPSCLWPGDELYVFGTSALVPGSPQKATDDTVAFETVTVNERSIAVCMAPRAGGGYPPTLMVQVSTNANPGAAEIDIQDAA